MRLITRKKTLAVTLLAALVSCSALAAAGATSYEFRYPIQGLVPGKTGCFTGMQLISSQTYNYDGTNNYDGSVQTATVPAGASCLKAVVNGGGGSGLCDYPEGGVGAPGGAGDQVTGELTVTAGATLQLIVAGGAGSWGSGGGLSGVFSGVPAQSTALLVAGGGGGGWHVAGSNASFSPTQLCASVAGVGLGGEGYGGSGDPSSCSIPSPFGTGGQCTYGAGGYGGGSGNVKTGGGSGLPGGMGGCVVNSTDLGGSGGTSYCSSQVADCADAPGLGGAGGSYNPTCDPGILGGNGSITLYFYN